MQPALTMIKAAWNKFLSRSGSLSPETYCCWLLFLWKHWERCIYVHVFLPRANHCCISWGHSWSPSFFTLRSLNISHTVNIQWCSTVCTDWPVMLNVILDSPELHIAFLIFLQYCIKGHRVSVTFRGISWLLWNMVLTKAKHQAVWNIYKISKSSEWMMVKDVKTVITENCQEYNIQIEFSVGLFSLLQKWMVSISVQWCVKNELNIINRKRGY